jgi:hypothetical protein
MFASLIKGAITGGVSAIGSIAHKLGGRRRRRRRRKRARRAKAAMAQYTRRPITNKPVSAMHATELLALVERAVATVMSGK